MCRSVITSGTITFFSLVALRIVPYYEGIDFEKYWLLPMGVLPIGLVALLLFLVSSIICMISVLRKKRTLKNLISIALLPLFVFVLYEAPIPHYTDGMRERVKKSLSLNELKTFAADVSAMNLHWNNYEENNKIIKQLKIKHPKILSLSLTPPRISVEEQYVNIFYGSPLAKHWGIIISDLNQFPIDHIPKQMYKKVYEGIWVYHDIW